MKKLFFIFLCISTLIAGYSQSYPPKTFWNDIIIKGKLVIEGDSVRGMRLVIKTSDVVINDTSLINYITQHSSDPHITDSTLFVEEPTNANSLDVRLSPYADGYFYFYWEDIDFTKNNFFSFEPTEMNWANYSGYVFISDDPADDNDGLIKIYLDNEDIKLHIDNDYFAVESDYYDIAVDSTEVYVYDKAHNKINLRTSKQKQGSLTDGAPTDDEIDAILVNPPSTWKAGYRVTIKDTDGSGLLYMIESDGTYWYYLEMTKAVNP